MPLTKKLISDSVLYKLAGGIPHASFPIHEEDIWNGIDSRVNALFKLKQFDTNLPNGETIPENTMLATYEGIAVTSLGNGKSKATLPIIPISLPKSVGIFLIYDPKNPDNPFIPLQRGQLALLKTDSLLNDLMGQIGYEPNNIQVTFTKDITMFGVNEVTMELCVFDISKYGINDMLPIPADYTDRIEDELIAEFSPVVAKTGIVNNFTNNTQEPPKK